MSRLQKYNSFLIKKIIIPYFISIGLILMKFNKYKNAILTNSKK